MKPGTLVKLTPECLRHRGYDGAPYSLTADSRGLVDRLFTAAGPFVRVLWLGSTNLIWVNVSELDEVT